jgi:hypothetical protein
MCSLIWGFLAEVRAGPQLRNITAQTFVWTRTWDRHQRAGARRFTFIDNFECVEDKDHVHVSFDTWDGLDKVRPKFSFPLISIGYGTKILEFEDAAEERVVVSHTARFREPLFETIRARTLTLSTRNEPQFHGDFALIYDEPWYETHKCLGDVKVSRYVKSYHRRDAKPE